MSVSRPEGDVRLSAQLSPTKASLDGMKGGAGACVVT
ncbi:hypothetical protein GX48_04724 [Paracoccidioides brasiliensis]|nr:hypothetical protein GX48_04724 [Paracoccidioides brasiliensis]